MRAYKSLFFLILFPLAAWAQEAPGEGTPHGLETNELTTWAVFGHVTDVKGNPLGNVRVRVDIGIGIGSVRSLKTTLQGEFQTQFTLDMNQHKRLTVMVVANKSGYLEAHETAEFGLADKTSGINIVLRDQTQNPDELSMASLIGALAPPLRQDAAKRPASAAGYNETLRGCEDLIDHHKAAAAVPFLSKGVERVPSCVECRLLLSLALLDAGSWAGARHQLDEVTKLNDAAKSKRPEPALIAGVLEEWRNETGQAAAFLQKAVEIAPSNVLALQELGRVLVLQKKWEAADHYLGEALRAGAPEDVRLLRVRALLGEGDIGEAGREMDQYTAGRDVRTLSPEARTLYIQVQDHLKLERYAKVKSVLTESPQELVKALPELKGLRPASDQTALAPVLKSVGDGVEAFFKNFQNTVSFEQVHQERLSLEGKVVRELNEDFQYLLLAHLDKDGMEIEENRTTAKGEISSLTGLDEGMMLTGGFASVSVLFHPAYQDGATFRYLGRQSLDEPEADKTNDGKTTLLKPAGTSTDPKKELPPEKEMHVIAFAQKPETARATGRFKTESGSALILVQGLAWIDPATFQIVRLRTDLLAPQPKVRLQRQTTEIQYKEVHFKEASATMLLPRDVLVTVELKGRVYRNRHRYSDFKLFNVETREERKSSALPLAPELAK